MLEIRGLTVSVGERRVLRNVDMHVSTGETVSLFGPNGCGKTSLLKTLMGVPQYTVESGRIIFKDTDITGLSIDERARLGIGMAFQRPPAVRGVRLDGMLRIVLEEEAGFSEERRDMLLRKLRLEGFRGRDLNLGFSGGEIKRSELVQLLAQDPDFVTTS
jgi:Fe-S cluster assembly ATP-binding protein